MKALRDFVEKTKWLREFSDTTSELAISQAFHVEPNPYCLTEWLLDRQNKGDSYNLIRSLIEHVRYRDGYFPSVPSISDTPCNPQFDFNWRGRAQHLLGKKTPLLVRIHIDSGRAESTSTAQEERIKLGRIIERYEDHASIEINDRKPTIGAYMSGGEAILGSKLGTVGGYLTNGQDYFGVSCAHVAAKGDDVFDGTKKLLGACVASSKLTPLPINQLCNTHCVTNTEMDACLFKTTSIPVQSGLTTSSNYGSGQMVEMIGAQSGRPNPYYIGSLGLYHLVDIDGADYCFKNLYSIRPNSFLNRNNILSGLSHRVRLGDSGGWITDVNQQEWLGMVIAKDGTEGFALDATAVFDWCENKISGSQVYVY